MLKLSISLLIIISLTAFSQVKTKNPFIKYGTWALLQAVPSPQFFEDTDGKVTKLKFGLEWQVIPVSYSFNTNKFLSKFNVFLINPVKRFTGSVETFFEPAIVTGEFKYAGLKKFMYKAGARIVLPAAQEGEYLAFSMGAGYYRQTGINGNKIDGVTYEAALYSFFGMLGLKFNYNQNALSRYNFGIYFKYY